MTEFIHFKFKTNDLFVSLVSFTRLGIGEEIYSRKAINASHYLY